MYIGIDIDDDAYEKAEEEYLELKTNYASKYPDLCRLMGKIVTAMSHRTKNERNKKIFEMRESGSRFVEIADAFSLSIERVRAIYKKELAKKQYREKLAEYKAEGRTPLFACFEEACVILDKELKLATRTYNALWRAQIIQKIEQGRGSLSEYSDEILLSIRNFGLASLEVARLANELYFKKCSED